MRKYKRKELGLTPLMLLGAGFALTVTVAVSFILAIISSLTKDPTALTGAFSLVALILSGAISGFVTSRVNGDGGALVGILASVIAASLILIVGLIWKRGLLNLGAALNILSFVGVSSVFSMLGKKRARTAHRKYRSF